MNKAITQAEFARLVDVNRSTVSRAIERGRLVAGADGLITLDVEDDGKDSLELCALAKWEASGSGRPHHRARMAQIREEKSARKAMRAAATDYADPAAEARSQDGMEALNLRLKRAETEKREHDADMARMDREQKAKNLLQREAVEYGLRDFTQNLSAMLDNSPDELAAELHTLQSVEEVRGHLASHFDALRHKMADAMATAMRLAKEEDA